MAKSEEILSEIRMLNVKLYGENGFEGDIPEIKGDIRTLVEHLDDHSSRLVKLEVSSKPSTRLKVGMGSIIGTAIAAFVMALGQKTGWW